jgi:hypothetical protein
MCCCNNKCSYCSARLQHVLLLLLLLLLLVRVIDWRSAWCCAFEI